MPTTLTPADDLLFLNSLDAGDQRLKDKVHERLLARSENDPRTGCWIYTGAWTEDGRGKIKAGFRVYPVARVAAWIYFRGFELWGPQAVYHKRRTCPPACFNPEHIAVAPTQAAARAALRALGRFGTQPSSRYARKLNRDKARQLRREAETLLECLSLAEAVRELSRREGISRKWLYRLLRGESWKGT